MQGINMVNMTNDFIIIILPPVRYFIVIIPHVEVYLAYSYFYKPL